MKASLRRLVQRREALVDLSRRQRALLDVELQLLGGRLRGVDRGLRIVRLVRAHPFLAAAVAAPVLLYRPRRTIRWIARAFTLYSFGRRALDALRTLRR